MIVMELACIVEKGQQDNFIVVDGQHPRDKILLKGIQERHVGPVTSPHHLRQPKPTRFLFLWNTLTLVDEIG
jgi:hypothetical protein